MSENQNQHTDSLFIHFLHSVKEYVLVIAMVLAAINYASHYVDEMSEHAPYLKWILYSLIATVIFTLYFFTVRPALIKRRELNLKPTGEPAEDYFTTSPRVDNKYHFFDSGYEKYLDWLRKPKSPILYLTGLSGAGKSSLINAYLVPELEKATEPKSNVFSLRSYHDPLRQLHSVLKLEDNPNAIITKEIVLDEIKKASALLSTNEQIIIIFDQFEEFFLLRNKPDDIEAESEESQTVLELRDFFQSFYKNPPKGVYFLLSYRDDFQDLIDQLELPARTEHINFEQVKLLSFANATKFLNNCPGLTIPPQQLQLILKEATSIDTPVGLRPIVLNLLGIILRRMAERQQLLKKEGNLIGEYIKSSLGKELQAERAILLRSMLTEFSTAKPKTLSELSKVSNLSVSQLDNQMILFNNSGLVRCLDTEETTAGKRKWQISHDFIALQLEKVVYGINRTFWKKARPWLAPLLMCFLIILTSFYYVNLGDARNKNAIKHLNKFGMLWNSQTKTLSSGQNSNFRLSDSLFKVVLPDLQTILPDTILWIFDYRDSIKLTDIKGINTITNLKKLTISYSGIKNIDCLNGLTELKMLSIHDDDSLPNVLNITQLPALTELAISGCSQIKEIRGLNNLKILKKLNVSFCDSLKSITNLGELVSLESITISDCKIFNNITGISKLKNLTAIDLSECESLDNIENLKDLQDLNLLVLKYCQDSTLNFISGIKKLKGLVLDYSKALSLENLKGINIDSISFQECNNIKSCKGLEGMDSLSYLNLSNTRLENLDYLINLPNLKTLDISYNRKLSKIAEVKNFKKLNSLNIAYCELFDDIEMLKDLNYLDEIMVKGTKITEKQVNELKEKNIKIYYNWYNKDY